MAAILAAAPRGNEFMFCHMIILSIGDVKNDPEKAIGRNEHDELLPLFAVVDCFFQNQNSMPACALMP
jgi:hypothetical protein